MILIYRFRIATGFICMLGCFCFIQTAQAQTCDPLPVDKKVLLSEALTMLHPYDGCDSIFAKCLEQKPASPIVIRLVKDICRQITAGKTIKEIEHALSKRAQSVMQFGKPAIMATDNSTLAGNPNAPVTIVVYACARCPFCKVIVPALFKEVTEGSLKNKVRMFFRPFPLKDHAGSLEGGLAFQSAAKLGRFWPFILKTYENYDQYCPQLFPEWAEAIGLHRTDFEREYADPKNRETLVASKQEGIRNKVEATPTLFINGRKYVYEMKQEVIMDVLNEVCEK